jgi:hypothetical protein
MLSRRALSVGLFAGFGVLASLLAEREAAACGGCFHPPTQVASDITDERMLLSVSSQQTTLYDQIRYSGNPSSFAWVLPIHGTVDVGLSADVLFDAVDTLTATQITPPPQNCPGPPSSCRNSFASAPSANAGAEDAAGGSVTVNKQENVGPYATVQLHATTSAALFDWLSQNGFLIPNDVKPTIEQYVTEGFDFLAMKLLPNQGIQAMRPVRVTAPGASLSLPLRMAAIGTGVSVGITIWVVADGRYEPQNFPWYHIEDKDLVWDWKSNSSNYTTLRVQNEATFGGKGWELESSITLNQQVISNVILSGGVYYGGGGVSGAAPSTASDDYLAVPAGDAGAGQTAEQVRDADVGALFAGMAGPNVRITRMRSDISHAAMTTDFVLKASSDQSEISNVRNVTQAVNLQCPIYNNCSVVGYGSPDQAASTNNSASAGPSGTTYGGGCRTTNRSLSMSDVGLAFASVLGLGLLRVSKRRNKKS